MLEISLNQGMFIDLGQEQMELINGGGWASVVGAIAVGAIGVIAGPPAIITGTIAVGAWYVGSVCIAGAGVLSAFGK